MGLCQKVERGEICYFSPYMMETDKQSIFLDKDSAWLKHKNLIFTWLQIILSMHILIKYAPIETKVVGANKRVKDFNCKYVNDTDSGITILDSTWFTTLVKSEGFKVRGHFRLQPYGPGMKEKRLIWIKDFEKTGYTREAKRPLNDDELPNSTEQQ